MAVHNEGFVPTPQSVILFQFINERTGTVSSSIDIPLAPMAPGETRNIEYRTWRAPIVFYNETHTITYTIDPYNGMPEMNENNNSYRKTGVMLLQTAHCSG